MEPYLKRGAVDAVLRALSEKKRQRLLALAASAELDGTVPAKDDLDELERIDRLKAVLKFQVNSQRRIWEVAALIFTAILLLVSAYFRVPSIPIDVDVRATQIRFKLTTGSEKTLIPGESGQILALNSATLSGMESAITEGHRTDQDPLELDRPSLPNPGSKTHTPGAPVQLEAITLPRSTKFTVTTAVAYSGAARGILLETSGDASVSALFMEPALPLPYPVTVEGKEITFELFPADATEPLAIFRNARVSEICFEDAGQSTLLGGTVYVSGGESGGLALRPSDLLKLQSDKPLFLRELSLVKGELHLILSTSDATLATLGGVSTRNLRPTWFQWVLAKWPNQLYATLTAWIGVWLALRRWWSSAE